MTKAQQIEFLREHGHEQEAGMLARGEIPDPAPDAFDTAANLLHLAGSFSALAEEMKTPRALAAEGDALRFGQQILGVHALIALATANSTDAVPLADLQRLLGDLPEPNSVTEWARQGKLPELVEQIVRELRR